MIRWEYNKERCTSDPKRWHRGSSGGGRGFICNACGREVTEQTADRIGVNVGSGSADICGACAKPWRDLIAQLKIAPEHEGVDVTDYTTPPSPEARSCEACAREAQRAPREVRDRAWLNTLLKKVGLR